MKTTSIRLQHPISCQLAVSSRVPGLIVALICMLSSFAGVAQSHTAPGLPACVRTVGANEQDVTINANEVVCIPAGKSVNNVNWNGAGTLINGGTTNGFSMPAGAALYNLSTARVQGDANLNGGNCRVYNSGYISKVNPGANSTGFIINNYADATIGGELNFRGATGTLYNSGTLTGKVALTTKGIFYNYAAGKVTNAAEISGQAATFYNYGTVANLTIQTNGTVYNYENAQVESLSMNSAGSVLYNDSRLRLNGDLTTGTQSVITNSATGVIGVTGSILLNTGTQFTNRGGVSTNGTFIVNDQCNVVNYQRITVAGNTHTNSVGRVENMGRWESGGYSNDGFTYNCGTIVSAGLLKNNSFGSGGRGLFNNIGTINVTGDIYNEGHFIGPTNGKTGVVTLTGNGDLQPNQGQFGAEGKLFVCGGTIRTTTGSGTTRCSDKEPLPAASQIGTCPNSGPLPVELTSFTAKVAANRVVVQWATASEKNNEKFVVERSTDGKQFVALLEVAGQGTSTTSHAYSAADTRPVAGTSYYRLRQVDRDGTSAYSPVASVTYTGRPTGALRLHPNPATTQLVVDLTAYPADCAVSLFDLSGRPVRTATLPGGTEQVLDVRLLPAGTYLLRVQSADQQTVERFVKQ